jgi:hypothetical protein
MIWKLAPYIAAIAAAGIVYKTIEHRGVEKGRMEVVIASKKAGEIANAKAKKARDAAAAPGASDRLRKDGSCRDCGP